MWLNRKRNPPPDYIETDRFSWWFKPLGYFCFLVYFLFTFYFIEARWLHTDSAFLFFRILNTEPLFYDRFGNYLQVFPAILLAEDSAPAKLILHVLNLALPLIGLIFFNIFSKTNSYQAIIIPLLFILQGGEAFFIGYNELLLATILMLAALLLFQKKNRLSEFLGINLMLCAIYSHPQAFLLLPFLLLPSIIEKSYRWLIPAATGLLLLIIRIFLSKSNPYDSQLLEQLVSHKNWHQFIESYSLFFFTHSLGNWLFFPGIALLVAAFYFIYKKQWLPFIFMLISCVFSLFILLFIYSHGDATSVMEKYFHTWAVICFLPLLFFNFSLKLKNIAEALVILSLGLFCFRVVRHSEYQRRYKEITKMENAYHNAGKTKILIHDLALEKYTDGSLWALPYQTLLIGALHESKGTVAVKMIADNQWPPLYGQYPDSTYGTTDFLPPLPVKKLNPAYFTLPNGPYFIDSSGDIFLNH